MHQENIPFKRDVFIITVKGVHTPSFIDLSSLFDISSYPELFLLSRLLDIERTSSTDIVDKLNRYSMREVN